jgi:hypothetical protein
MTMSVTIKAIRNPVENKPYPCRATASRPVIP